MSAGEVVAGAIVLLLGAFGLLAVLERFVLPVNLGVLSIYLTTLGATIMFGAIAIVGFAVMIGGLASIDDDEPTRTIVERQVVVVS